MTHRAAFTVFATALVVVLIGGMALAQLGVLTPVSAPKDHDVATRLAAETPAPAAPIASAEPAAAGSWDDPGHFQLGWATFDSSPSRPELPIAAPPTPPAQPGEEVSPEDGDDGDEPDTTPPMLEIVHPRPGQVFDEKTITFEGMTEPGATVAAGRYSADVDDEGRWRIRLVLSEGSNLATLTATDAAGNIAEASVRIVYQPRPTDPPRIEFTANQRYGASEATPPHDVFWGTAPPGATIHIESEYGGRTVRASTKGRWEAKVTFPEAPVGHPFRVVVESSDGGRAEFEFVRVGDRVDHEFTANQKYGSCGEEIPYDVFWGRADGGEQIWVESPYGAGDTVAGPEGHWEIRIEFPDAPPGKVFEVVVEAENGGRKVFTFVNTGGEH